MDHLSRHSNEALLHPENATTDNGNRIRVTR